VIIHPEAFGRRVFQVQQQHRACRARYAKHASAVALHLSSVEAWRNNGGYLLAGSDNWGFSQMWVKPKQCHVYHPPVITIFIGGMWLPFPGKWVVYWIRPRNTADFWSLKMNGQVRKVADEDDQYHQFHNLFGSDVIPCYFCRSFIWREHPFWFIPSCHAKCTKDPNMNIEPSHGFVWVVLGKRNSHHSQISPAFCWLRSYAIPISIQKQHILIM